MNYQNVEKLQSKFKPEKGWLVERKGFYIVISNDFWEIEVEDYGTRFDDGCGFPYINLKIKLGREGYESYSKYLLSFNYLKNCISYIKRCGVV